MVAKKPVSVRAVLGDVRAGMSKEELMSRHGLSKHGLKSLLIKMSTAGYLKKSDLERFRKGSPKDGKRRVSAKNVLGDIKAGLTDAGLMKKYGLSVKGLDALFARLLKERLLTDEDLLTRGSQLHATVDIVPSSTRRNASANHERRPSHRPLFKFYCPQCRSRETEDHDVCPRCGFRVKEFNEQYASRGRRNSYSGEENKREPGNAAAARPEGGYSEAISKEAGHIDILRRALEVGVLSPAEFSKKREELLLRGGNGEAMPALKDLLKAGLVTKEEFESKRRELSERPTKFARLKEAFEFGNLSETQFARGRAELIGGEPPAAPAAKSPSPSAPRTETQDKQPEKTEDADPGLRPGERFLNSGEIISAPWFLTVFGRMTLTDQRLLFRPHRWAVVLAAFESIGIAWLAHKVRNEPLGISISRIQSVSRKTFLGVFKGMVVHMRSGIEHRFLFPRKAAHNGEELTAALEGLLRKR